MVRDVRRADAIAVSDCGKSLDVAAQQAGEDLGLGLAQLRELLGDMGHRAVVLADLGAARGVLGRSREAVGGEGLGEHSGALLGLGGLDQRTVAVLEFAHAVAGEGDDCLISPGALQVAQGVGGKTVISLFEMIAAGIGDDEDLGRTATTPGADDALFAGLDDPVGQQLIQVSAHGGRCEPEPLRKIDRRGRAFLEDRVGDTFTGWCIVDGRRLLDPNVFHNTIVPLIHPAFNEGKP